MASLSLRSALSQYQNAGIAAATGVSPHRLIEMLLGGALDRLAQARGSLQRGDLAQKLKLVSSVVAIIEHLRMTLDFSAGGDVAQNLGGLYDYMLRRLMQANADNDAKGLDEVSELLRILKSGWDELQQPQPTRH